MATKRKRTTRRRTTTRTPARRRRRIGAIKGFDAQSVAGLGTGAVTSTAITGLVSNFVPNLDPKIQAGVKVALGVALPQFLKMRGWDKFIKGVGDAYVVTGISELAADTMLNFEVDNAVEGAVRGLSGVFGKGNCKIPTIGVHQNNTSGVPTISGAAMEEIENNY